MTFPAEIKPSEIEQVTFFKRDQITTDLICCEIACAGQVYEYHEEWDKWPDLLHALAKLEGFRGDWFSQVSQPPFEASRFVAFAKGQT